VHAPPEVLPKIRVIRTVDVEYDLEKDEKNRRERGLTLALGSAVIADARASGAVVEDTRYAFTERRFIAYGKVHGRLMV